MSTPTVIGVAASRGAYTARYLHYGEHPDTLVPLLRRIWDQTFGRDTAAMADALLARDWSDLHINPQPRRREPQPVTGLGHPSPNSDTGVRHGTLGEDIGGFLEWLYLLHPDHGVVVVYEATCHGRWLRHSLHHLDPVEELFVTEPADDQQPAMTVCTVCGAVDDIQHVEMPSMTGAGVDTSTLCLRCGSSVATDPMFGAHVTRTSWPPHPGRPTMP